MMRARWRSLYDFFLLGMQAALFVLADVLYMMRIHRHTVAESTPR